MLASNSRPGIDQRCSSQVVHHRGDVLAQHWCMSPGLTSTQPLIVPADFFSNLSHHIVSQNQAELVQHLGSECFRAHSSHHSLVSLLHLLVELEVAGDSSANPMNQTNSAICHSCTFSHLSLCYMYNPITVSNQERSNSCHSKYRRSEILIDGLIRVKTQSSTRSPLRESSAV